MADNPSGSPEMCNSGGKVVDFERRRADTSGSKPAGPLPQGTLTSAGLSLRGGLQGDLP